MDIFTVRHYITEDEHDPFQEWLKKLRGPVAKDQVVKRVGRTEAGNFSDRKPRRKGVRELRINQDSGYCVYCTMAGAVVVLLLCGSDKGTQGADIERVTGFWRD